MVFYVEDGEDSITRVKYNGLSYVEFERFYQPSGKAISVNNTAQIVPKTWKQQKNLVDKIHKHVCGHSSLTDYQNFT